MKKLILIATLFITAFSLNAQTTQLNPAYCGITVSTFDQIFTCETVPNATQYEFEFTNQATSIVTTGIRTRRTISNT